MEMYHLSVSSRKRPETPRKFGGNIPRNPLDKALFFAHNGLKSGNRERTIFTLERGVSPVGIVQGKCIETGDLQSEIYAYCW